MKPFDLEAALQGEPVAIRNAEYLQVIAVYQIEHLSRPVLAIVKDVDGYTKPLWFHKEGDCRNFPDSRSWLLYMVPKKVSGWINIYREPHGYVPGNFIYDSKEQAEGNPVGNRDLATTIPIEFEV